MNPGDELELAYNRVLEDFPSAERFTLSVSPAGWRIIRKLMVAVWGVRDPIPELPDGRINYVGAPIVLDDRQATRFVFRLPAAP